MMTFTTLLFYCCVVIYLTTLTAVYGFSRAQITSHAHQRQPPLYFSVAPPEIAIDTHTLLYQAYTALTVKEVKDILRQYGAKVSGNKSELIDRLGEILDGKRRQKEDEQHPRYVAKERQKTLKEYNEMTLKELREILRGRGLNSEGNKRELVHRVLISGYEAKSQLLAVVNNHDDNLELASSSLPTTNNHIGLDASNNWQIIEPTIENCQYLTNDEKEEIVLGADGTELPFLSQLLFVNKPSGWSTLPTKQQLDNPTCPTYPCLSKSVVEWLQTDPRGVERLRNAQADEQRWWDSVLEIEPQNSMQRRELKKRIRKHEKQLEKMSTFEPRPAHRLDIDTSGIVCIALTQTALRHANMLFEKKSVEKELDAEEGCVEKQYVALVEGSMDKESSNGTISHAIGKVWVDDHNEWACDIHDDGSFAFIRHNGSSDTTTTKFVPDTLREAITLYNAVDFGTVQSKGDSMSVTRVELTPVTGRGHQLRLHMASMKHPIVGDYMHGDEHLIDKDDQLCLHASKLSMDSFCFASNNGDTASLQKCRIVVESAPPF